MAYGATVYSVQLRVNSVNVYRHVAGYLFLKKIVVHARDTHIRYGAQAS